MILSVRDRQDGGFFWSPDPPLHGFFCFFFSLFTLLGAVRRSRHSKTNRWTYFLARPWHELWKQSKKMRKKKKKIQPWPASSVFNSSRSKRSRDKVAARERSKASKYNRNYKKLNQSQTESWWPGSQMKLPTNEMAEKRRNDALPDPTPRSSESEASPCHVWYSLKGECRCDAHICRREKAKRHKAGKAGGENLG